MKGDALVDQEVHGVGNTDEEGAGAGGTGATQGVGVQGFRGSGVQG